MKPKTAIEKGKAFEKYIAKELTANGFGSARREIGSGSGLFKGDIFCPNFPFMIEAKNQAVYKINQWIDQTKRETKIGFHDPDKWVLMFKDYRSPNINPTIYALTDFYQFLQLAKSSNDPLIKEPDSSLKFELDDLKYRITSIIKELDDKDNKEQALIWKLEDLKKRSKSISNLLK